MSSSKLQETIGNILYKAFPQFDIKENYRPEWLMSSNFTRLELDFYIEELSIGFEIQGLQHYQYTPFFQKDYSDFEKRKQYDEEKRDLCKGRGIRLIEVSSLLDAIIEIDKLSKIKTPTSEKYMRLNEESFENKTQMEIEEKKLMDERIRIGMDRFKEIERERWRR